jgi:hypothetical protein
LLEYRGAEDAAAPSRLPRAAFLIGSLPLVVVPFVNFTWSVSPADVVRGVLTSGASVDQDVLLGLLAAPFFLGIPIFLWQARLLVSPAAATSTEQRVARWLAATSGGMTLGFFAYGVFRMIRDGNPGPDFAITVPGPLVIAAGTALLWWVRRAGLPARLAVTTALHTAYLANAVVCLVGFADDPRIGWWLTLVGTAVLTSELAVTCTVERRRSTTS